MTMIVTRIPATIVTMVTIASPPPAPTPTYNVRELLELERKLYEDSIEKQERQLQSLISGEMEEFVAQCRPFDLDRAHELQVAGVRRELNKRNATDLFEFEVQQAEDDYQDKCHGLKRRMLSAARDRRARIVATLQGIEAAAITRESGDQCEENGDAQANPQTVARTHFINADGSLDTSSLVQELRACHTTSQATFNLHHLKHDLPPADVVVADVQQEVDRLKAYENQRKDPETVCAVVVDTTAAKVWIGLMDVFTVLDHVILWSSLSDEEFYGQIVAVHDESMELKLVCGTRTHVGVAQLRSQLCTLRRQDPSQQPIDAANAVLRTPKRKRQRRKHTIGVRQKI